MLTHIFTTPIYLVNVGDTEEGKLLSEAIYEIDIETVVEPNRDIWDCKVDTGFFSRFDLSKKIIEAADKCILHHAMNFASAKGIQDLDNLSMSIDNIWLNRYFKGYSQEPHHHIGSTQMSFNYVYKTTSPDTSFKFINTRQSDSDVLWGLVKNFSFCENEIRLDLRSGDLVLFPSFLVHSVFHRNEGDRITLSGNISVER